MYAHQVIEDLKNNYRSKEVKCLIRSIKSAQCFNFGSDPSFYHDFETKNKKLLIDDGGVAEFLKTLNDINIPYNTCWFDFEYEQGWTKYACLIERIVSTEEKHIDVYLFNKSPKQKIWELMRLKIVLSNDFKTISYEPHGFWSPFGYTDIIENIDCRDINSKINFNDFFITEIHFRFYIFFLVLLSCKNITTQGNPPPLRLNKKRIKSGKQPLFTYKTLVIKPTGKKQEFQAAQGLWDNRIHLCRGHFKTYTATKPLFGKITGRYWWQPSIRGNKDKGVVIKNYIVKY